MLGGAVKTGLVTAGALAFVTLLTNGSELSVTGTGKAALDHFVIFLVFAGAGTGAVAWLITRRRIGQPENEAPHFIGRWSAVTVWTGFVAVEALGQTVGVGLPQTGFDAFVFGYPMLSMTALAIPGSVALALAFSMRDSFPGQLGGKSKRGTVRSATEHAEDIERARQQPVAQAQSAPTAPPAGVVAIERPKIRFTDVIGLDQAKLEVTEAMRLMRNPSEGRAYGVEPTRGILLHGPPGTGKTMFAKAVAGEFGAAFIPVSASQLKSKWVGETEANIKAVFDLARQNAGGVSGRGGGGVVIFIDELDAIAASRDGSNVQGHERGAVTALLEQMDGIQGKDRAPLVIAATNYVEILDAAILRPGRFDRKILVGLPDVSAREAMLRKNLESRKDVLDAGVDLKAWAQGTEGWSPAQLAQLVKDAATDAWRRKSKIDQEAFETAWRLQ
jgi:AAA+ superfamily predicted ATPase